MVNTKDRLPKEVRDKCARFKESLLATTKTLVLKYHNIGRYINRWVEDNGKVWGLYVDGLFADELKISKPQISMMRRMAKRIDTLEIDFFIENSVALSAAIALVSVRDKHTRRQLVLSYTKEKWTADRLKAEIAKFGFDNVASHGGLNITTSLRRVANRADDILGDLTNYEDYLRDYNSRIPDEISDKARAEYYRSLDNIEKLSTKLTAILESQTELK